MKDLIEKIVLEKDMDKAYIVVDAYKPLLISSIRKFYNKPNLYEELLQEGILEICNAILDYDSTKNIPFGGYLKTRIYYFYLGKNNYKDSTLSLDEKIVDDESLTLNDILADSTNIEEEFMIREDNKTLYNALEKLTNKQRNIVIDFYFNGLNLKDISTKYGISYRTAVNTKTVALKKLKRFLEE